MREITNEEMQTCYAIADARLKTNGGHAYVTTLKTRCHKCGRSPNQPGKCRHWFSTFLEHLTSVMIERHGRASARQGSAP